MAGGITLPNNLTVGTRLAGPEESEVLEFGVKYQADWGYFIDEKKKGGLGAVLEYNFLNFVFTKLNLEKLNCEVLETNPTVIKLHKKFLFQEEGFRRSNINQNDVRIGVHFLGLTKDEWLEGFSSVYTKYQSAFEKYNVVIETKDKKNIIS